MKEQILEAGCIVHYNGVPYVLKENTVLLGNTPIETIPDVSMRQFSKSQQEGESSDTP